MTRSRLAAPVPVPSLALALLLAISAGLTGCGKAQEKLSDKLSEKATEAMIESSLSKDGTHAKVDLSGGGAKVTTTDASGKTTEMQMGHAAVSEADVGLPFYPGATPVEGQSTRIVTPEAVNVSIVLHSADAADKVAAYYRERLKSQSAGKPFMDMSEGDGKTMFTLGEGQSGLVVSVEKVDDGSQVSIVATREHKP